MEEGLGLRLPADYKLLAETLPDGIHIGPWQLNLPGDFGHPIDDLLGFHAYGLEDMRAARASGLQIPHPIYPEPGGLLPWARGPRMDPVCWLTNDDDPDRWPLVAVDAEFQRWRTLPGPASQFLINAVGGQPDSQSDRESQFLIADVERSPESSRSGTPGSPAGDLDSLAVLIGRAPAGVARTDWAEAEEFMGVRLPADCRRFVDTYGPGRIGDIVVTAPGAAGDADMFGLLARTIATRPAGDLPIVLPVYPEHEGLIAWGETADGWIFAWAQADADPTAGERSSSDRVASTRNCRTIRSATFSRVTPATTWISACSWSDHRGQTTQSSSRSVRSWAPASNGGPSHVPSPACAGSRRSRRASPDHPRVRGEHVCSAAGSVRLWGHPRVCGEHWIRRPRANRDRRTSLRGTRRHSPTEINRTRDHPRVCGEHAASNGPDRRAAASPSSGPFRRLPPPG
ncbi:hypothetical protein [Asanoa iriomotensis]|nr:hypothetical protein [Asanoa iriomotensis]